MKWLFMITPILEYENSTINMTKLNLQKLPEQKWSGAPRDTWYGI